MNKAEIIRRGNIIVNEWTGERNVGCYLGNGRFGAVMSSTGLNLSPEQQKDENKNVSHFKHMSHWGRFNLTSPFTNEETSADYLLPLFRLYWEKDHEGISDYKQCHDLYDGVLNTSFKTISGEHITVTSWFDAVRRNLSGIIIDASEEITDNRICLSAITKFNPWSFMCRKEYDQTVTVEKTDNEWKLTICCIETVNRATAEIYISSNMDIEADESNIIFHVKKGHNSIIISVGEPVKNESADSSLKRTTEKNNEMWQQVGWMDYSDNEEIQKVWVRSMAYLLTSYDADCEYIQPSNCMGINGFPYNFVPDIGNVAPSLMKLGCWDIVAHWVEKFARDIDEMRQYAQFLWPEAEGVFPPWELNFGEYKGYHRPNAPMIFFYEAHNTGYLAKLAMQASEHSNNDAWNKKYAYPLIDECAKFFRKFCNKESDGLWHLKWYPCMGRDEAGGVNKDDYLCTLITAKYSFQSAIKCGLDKNGDYAKILSEGLAFESLRSDRGTLHTCRGADDFGKQKHPVQLEGAACFPTEDHPSNEEIKAYELRYDITQNARKPKFYGWTLAQLLMVGTNMKNYEEWFNDWNLLRPSNNTDELWIQFYESSDSFRSAFYTATHGMVLESLIRNCVNDYWGKLEIGACLPKNTTVSFGNIKTGLGVTVSGKVKNGTAIGSILANRDTCFKFQDKEIRMKCGEEIDFAFSI